RDTAAKRRQRALRRVRGELGVERLGPRPVLVLPGRRGAVGERWFGGAEGAGCETEREAHAQHRFHGRSSWSGLTAGRWRKFLTGPGGGRDEPASAVSPRRGPPYNRPQWSPAVPVSCRSPWSRSARPP